MPQTKKKIPYTPEKKTWFRQLGTIAWNLLLIFSGSILCAAAVNGILIPKDFISSGVTGLSILIHHLAKDWPVGMIYFLLNIPLFLIGWIYVGRRFFIYSIVGMLAFSLALYQVTIPIMVTDPILSALLAGIIVGLGSGLILRSYGSAGGSDILSIVLLKRFSIRLGTTVLLFNSALLGFAAWIFSLDAALYALIFLFVSTRMMNLVVTGLSQRKAVLVISSRWEELSQAIIDIINRGVTIIPGEGAYSRKKEKILYVVISFQELAPLKQVIRNIDPEAFMVVSETLEVMGKRIGNQPHW